jgi:nucleoside-diphosphate-sugar epimerase
MIRDMNIIGGNLGDAHHILVLSSTDDIAEAAAEALLRPDFKGHTVRYVPSDERTTGEVAKVLGAAVGKAELPWVEFTDEQMLAGLRQAGLAEEIAKNFTEMGAAIRAGIMWQDFFKNKPARRGKIKLEDFAARFASVYNAG